MFVSSSTWINKKYPSPYPVGCTTMCYTDDDRDTSVFPDVEVHVCNGAVRNERARTRVKQDDNGVFNALPWIPVIWKNAGFWLVMMHMLSTEVQFVIETHIQIHSRTHT